ncbi:hypothetical protein IFM89_030826 [Coptis chinensis]|uniref:MADS-box domain-containing protein n=1 Tax=Coptis chinensis TaxID=261450 RepID=A0A835HZ62_9MAGN|nr:hypothetical protein IFM89_030826 [Coptis chinensis]
MARKKVKLQWIANDSARRATFKKRKKGLMKKVSELSTLCGVEACAIVYGPYDPQPDVWHSPSEVHRVLMRFKSMPEMEQSKKMMNQEGFLRQRVVKLNEQLKRQQRENREQEITQLMNQGMMGKSLHDVSMEDLGDLGWLIEEKLKVVRAKMEVQRKAMAAPQMNIGNERMQVVGGGGGGGVGGGVGVGGGNGVNMDMSMESLQRQQSWFVEMMNSEPQEQRPNNNAYFGDDLVTTHYGDATAWPKNFFS